MFGMRKYFSVTFLTQEINRKQNTFLTTTLYSVVKEAISMVILLTLYNALVIKID